MHPVSSSAPEEHAVVGLIAHPVRVERFNAPNRLKRPMSFAVGSTSCGRRRGAVAHQMPKEFATGA
jgi:hypothetical protein